jgi:hypothetical protein
LPAGSDTEVQKAQDTWREQKIQYDKSQADIKRQEEEARRKAAAEAPKPGSVKVKDQSAVGGTGKP